LAALEYPSQKHDGYDRDKIQKQLSNVIHIAPGKRYANLEITKKKQFEVNVIMRVYFKSRSGIPETLLKRPLQKKFV